MGCNYRVCREHRSTGELFRTLVLALGLIIGYGTEAQEEIRILTEDYPPYNYEEDGEIKGFTTEIVKEILSRTGNADLGIWIMPWARAYKEVQGEANVVLYTMAKTPERDDMFKWVGPVSDRKIWLYKLKSRDDIQVETIDDAKNYTITGVKNSGIMNYFVGQGFIIDQHILLARNETISFRKFLHGRADLINKVPMALAMSLKKEGLTMNHVEPLVLVTGNLSYYLAFNRETSDKIVNEWQSSLDDMKEDGTYKKIKAKYIY